VPLTVKRGGAGNGRQEEHGSAERGGWLFVQDGLYEYAQVRGPKTGWWW
jgi:hypothetical protein